MPKEDGKLFEAELASCAASGKEGVEERFHLCWNYMVEQQRKIVGIQSRYPKGFRPHGFIGLGIQELNHVYQETVANAQANYGVKLDNYQ